MELVFFSCSKSNSCKTSENEKLKSYFGSILVNNVNAVSILRKAYVNLQWSSIALAYCYFDFLRAYFLLDCFTSPFSCVFSSFLHFFLHMSSEYFFFSKTCRCFLFISKTHIFTPSFYFVWNV